MIAGPVPDGARNAPSAVHSPPGGSSTSCAASAASCSRCAVAAVGSAPCRGSRVNSAAGSIAGPKISETVVRDRSAAFMTGAGRLKVIFHAHFRMFCRRWPRRTLSGVCESIDSAESWGRRHRSEPRAASSARVSQVAILLIVLRGAIIDQVSASVRGRLT